MQGILMELKRKVLDTIEKKGGNQINNLKKSNAIYLLQNQKNRKWNKIIFHENKKEIKKDYFSQKYRTAKEQEKKWWNINLKTFCNWYIDN